jgi:hypothetical protein
LWKNGSQSRKGRKNDWEKAGVAKIEIRAKTQSPQSTLMESGRLRRCMVK